MKKVLLASTALVAFAGFAHADAHEGGVKVEGSAEMGVVGGDDRLPGGDSESLQFFNDIDVNFVMSGTTSGGLQFGAEVNLDEADNIDLDPTDNLGVAIFIKGDFGTVTMGDTEGAMDFALTESNVIGGSINDAETEHSGFFGAYHDGAGIYDGQIVRYNHTIAGFTFAVSVEAAAFSDGDVNATLGLDDAGAVNATDALLDATPPQDQKGTDYDLNFAIGGNYTFEFAGGDVTLGLGYQSLDADAVGGLVTDNGVEADETAAIVGVSATLGLDSGFKGNLTFVSGDIGGIEDSTHISVGAGYEGSGFEVGFNYGQFDFGDDTAATGFGLAAGYDLGGGAKVLFGYGDSVEEDANGNETVDSNSYSLGFSFSF